MLSSDNSGNLQNGPLLMGVAVDTNNITDSYEYNPFLFAVLSTFQNVTGDIS
jgi:hypothetical protein